MRLLHLGGLHPIEQVLTVLLAVGPFVALAVLVWLRRGERDPEDSSGPGSTAGPGAA